VSDHPIRDPRLHADVEQWTAKVIEQTGSGTIEVTIEFNVKDRRFLGYRLGGAASRRHLTPATEQP
jgi:hypothetical protein